MLKIGVMIHDLGASQLAYEFITETNKLYYPQWSSVDVIAFYETLNKNCLPLLFACMNVKECWSFDGVVVATSLNAARRLITFPAPYKKLFYVYDLEWTQIVPRSYDELAKVYTDPGLEIISRSDKHAKTIEQSWGVKVTNIIKNFNMKEVVKICEAFQNGVKPGYDNNMRLN